MSETVEPGQEYVACAPVASEPKPRFIRIRVLHAGPFDGEAKALVATIHRDRHGRVFLDRSRGIKLTSLHTDGKPRKTGYRLVRNADGSEA